MHKFAIIIILSVFILGCTKPYIIVNDSDYEVKVILKCSHECKYTIKPHTSINIDERIYLVTRQILQEYFILMIMKH